MTTLRLGDRGDEVRMLQLHLAAHGAKLRIDGDFGAKTDAAVRAFQERKGLATDGVVGPRTWAAVFATPVDEYPADRCYPLRALPDLRVPTVTSRHAIHNPSRPTHRGVDFFFRRLPTDPPMKSGDGGMTENGRWWIPPGTLAIAAADGVVEIEGDSKTGHRVWIRHEGGLATGGFHLRNERVDRGQRVELGADLGEVGDNPADTDAVHLHWEVYRGALADYPRGTLDPEIWLRGARILPAR